MKLKKIKKNIKYKDTVIKKNIQKNNIKNKKINTNDILIKMKPINYILDDTNKKISNTNVSQLITDENKSNNKNDNIEINDDFLYNINIQKYNDDKPTEIDIEFNTNNQKNIDKYQLFKNFINDFNILPLKNEQNIKESNNEVMKIKDINIPKKIYQKTVLNKPFKDIIKNNN